MTESWFGSFGLGRLSVNSRQLSLFTTPGAPQAFQFTSVSQLYVVTYGIRFAF